ncbi:vitamin K epoxide reductase family protein [Edaphobacter paludis]|uniref:Vitamin K epoxide reductase family protein n=1 Tax=Edaphobacter paludis TaxID=3035702 RepID=A0AAU7D4V8_9BACT
MKYLVALLALAGLGVSVMGLLIHNMDPAKAPPCAVSEHWDCGSVNHSRFSVFPPRTFDEAPGKVHIPVATVGIVAYAVIAVLALMERWWLVFETAQLGFMCASFLSYLEAFVMEKWCIYCVWSWGIMTAILLLTIGWLVYRRRGGRIAWQK